MKVHRNLSMVLAIVVATLLMSIYAEAFASAIWEDRTFDQLYAPQAGGTTAYTKFPVPSKFLNNKETGQAIYVWDESSTNGRLLRIVSSSAHDRWTQLLPTQTMGYPTPREGACLAWSGTHDQDYGLNDGSQNLILFGGWTGTAFSNELNIYNMLQNKWEFKGNLAGPSPRSNMGCSRFTSIGAGDWEFNGILMYGGWNGQTLDDVWVFCDHPYNELDEPQEYGCNDHPLGEPGNTPQREWEQGIFLSWCYDVVGGRSGHAQSEPIDTVKPITSAEHYAAMIWGGLKYGVGFVRQPTVIEWDVNELGLLIFDCFAWQEISPTPAPRQLMAAAYRKNPSNSWNGFVIQGGEAGAVYNDLMYVDFTNAATIIYTYPVQSGDLPGPRKLSVLTCRKGPDACFDSSSTNVKYMFFGGIDDLGVNRGDTRRVILANS